MFELTDNGTTQFISAGNNRLFTGTTTMTTASVRNQANSANLTYTITGNNWQAAALPYGDGTSAEPHAYVAQAAHPTLVYHRMPTPGTGATFSVTTVSSGVITALSVTAAGSGYNDDLVMSFCIGLWLRDTSLKLRQQGIELHKKTLSQFSLIKMQYRFYLI